MNSIRELDELAYNPYGTELCTGPFFEFVAEYDFILGYLMFIVSSASHTDHVLKTTAEYLRDEKLQKTFSENIIFRRIQYYGPILSRDVLTDLANNFLIYLSEILQAAARKRPEILRSSERVTTEEILQFESVDDIVSFIADRKISELSYGGLRQTEQFIKDRLGLELFDDQSQRELLTILVELRNIQTHNRGKINRLFLKRIGRQSQSRFTFVEDQIYHADFETIVLLSNNAIKVALSLDEKIAEKFRLERQEFRPRYSKLQMDRHERLKRMPSPRDAR
jgi:hypothetical protein